MKQISQFKGAPNRLGNIPQYALYVSKTGAWEIHRWQSLKKHPDRGRFEFYKATGTIENTVERMITLVTGDILATEIKTLINAWNDTKTKIIKARKWN